MRTPLLSDSIPYYSEDLGILTGGLENWTVVLPDFTAIHYLMVWQEQTGAVRIWPHHILHEEYSVEQQTLHRNDIWDHARLQELGGRKWQQRLKSRHKQALGMGGNWPIFFLKPHSLPMERPTFSIVIANIHTCGTLLSTIKSWSYAVSDIKSQHPLKSPLLRRSEKKRLLSARVYGWQIA